MLHSCAPNPKTGLSLSFIKNENEGVATGGGLRMAWGGGYFLSLDTPLISPPFSPCTPDPISLSHFPLYSLPFILFPSATWLCLAFMSVLGISRVGVWVSALPRYFCLLCISFALPAFLHLRSFFLRLVFA